MAGPRTPNGLDDSNDNGKVKWEADRGDPAVRPSGDGRALGAVVRAGESFPYLPDALEGKRDDEIVGLLNFQLRKHSYSEWERIDRQTLPTGERKVVIAKHKKPIKRTLKPFEAIETTVAEARRLMGKWNRAMMRAPRLAMIVLHGKAGDCGRSRTFTYGGKTFPSCPFERCAQHGHAERPWSIHRAQQFIITLRSPAAIRRFVAQFDSRPEVAVFAMAEAAAREAAIQANKGEALASSASSAVI